MLTKLQHNSNQIPIAFSYGIQTGNYIFDPNELVKYANNEEFLKEFCFVPKKTNFSNLIWDFDFKVGKCPEELIKREEEIVLHITDIIIQQIKFAFKTETNDIKFIYAIKNKGSGVHLYFPNIIVDRDIHAYLYVKTMDILKQENYLGANDDQTIINQIFDACVSKANSLRMFYFYSKDGSYYFPCPKRSTYKIGTNKAKNMLLSYTNTNRTCCQPKLDITQENIMDAICVINKKKKDADIKIKKVKNNIEYIQDFLFMLTADKKKMFLELANILDMKRLESYETWISIVLLFKTYGLINECIELSKKSKSFDNNTVNIIMNTFRSKIKKDCMIIGTLIYMCHHDNFIETRKILEKYGNTNYSYIGLNSVSQILLQDNMKNITLCENAKYISKAAQQKMIDALNKETHNVIMIGAPTGSGKTTTIYSILENQYKNNNNSKMLSVVTRRSMVACHLSGFNGKNENNKNNKKKLHFSSYLDKYAFADNLVSSLEFLRNNNDATFEVLILDEISSLINYFYSSTLDNIRKQCLERLLYIIKNAKCIICCDAYVTDACFQLFPDKNIFFYKNSYQNKKDVVMNIHYTKHNNENSHLTQIADIIGTKYARQNKPVLIFSDKKATTIKLHELLKKYNPDDDYYRLIHADSGDQQILENLDELSKTKCIIASPKITYGLDLSSHHYEEIYGIYSQVSGNIGLSAFHFWQQISRSRNHNKVSIYFLDPYAKKYKHTYKSFNKCKIEEDTYIESQMMFIDKINKKHNKDTAILGEIVCYNPIIKNINYYNSYYNYAFNGNKCDIFKTIAREAGYIITEHDFECEKIDTKLNKVVKDHKILMVDLAHKIIDAEPIDESNDKFVSNLKEKIENKKQYVSIKHPNYTNIICDDDLFKSYINRKLLDMPLKEFEKELLKINSKECIEIFKNNSLHDKILILFMIEKHMNIKRYELDKLKDCDWKQILAYLKTNNDTLIQFFTEPTQSKKYAIARVLKILNKIDSANKVQKLMADMYNIISAGTIICNSERIYTKAKILETVYTFKIS